MVASFVLNSVIHEVPSHLSARYKLKLHGRNYVYVFFVPMVTNGFRSKQNRISATPQDKNNQNWKSMTMVLIEGHLVDDKGELDELWVNRYED